MSTIDPVIIGCCGANLASLQFALQRLGHDVPVSNEPERIAGASHVFLPGVGAARDAMSRLRDAGMHEMIPTLRQPVLGICLGMQLLFRYSHEEATECLGVIDAEAELLPEGEGRPVPEMGWNALRVIDSSDLLRGVPQGGYAYFVHSYAVPVGQYTVASSEYGVEFSAAVRQGNFFGTQFHPERSSSVGATILANFLAVDHS